MADLSIVAITAEATRNAPEALRAAIVARAKETSKKLDGVGADIVPLASQLALLRVARREIEDELRDSAQPKPATAEELADWKIDKAGCGKKRTLTTQGAMVNHYIAKLGSPVAGNAKAKAVAEPWHIKLGDLTTKGRNPHKEGLKAIKQIDKNKIPNEGTIFNKAMGHDFDDGPGEKKSKNPYKNEMTPATQKEIASIIARKGTQFAASLARSAGKTISGHPLTK